jgi:hypothetical protein
MIEVILLFALLGSQAPKIAIATTCDASLWSHVYNPTRVTVYAKCVVVTGTVVDATAGKQKDGVRHEADGGARGWLKLDPEFSSMVDARNMSSEGGNLVFEIVCEFNATQADAKRACAGYQRHIPVPPVGSHVRMMGSYVEDTNHEKCSEILPVSSIDLLHR